MKDLDSQKIGLQENQERVVDFLISARQREITRNSLTKCNKHDEKTEKLFEKTRKARGKTLEMQALLLQQQESSLEQLDSDSLQRTRHGKFQTESDKLREENKLLQQKLALAKNEMNKLWKQHTALQLRFLKAYKKGLNEQMTNVNQARTKIRGLVGKPITMAANSVDVNLNTGIEIAVDMDTYMDLIKRRSAN